MPPQTLEKRVESLEQRVTALDGLPERVGAVEAQIVQFRAEVRDEFSAVRGEIRAGDEETRRVLGTQIEETRRVLGAQIEELRRSLDERVDETRRFMRVLNEEVIARIATIQEGRPGPPRRKKKPVDK